jgi:hypothetical protein
MPRPFRHLDVERKNDIFCARLKRHRLDEKAIIELAAELVSLITEQGCRKLVLSLGSDAPELLYSVFLAKLVMVRRRLLEGGGAPLKLCEVNANVYGVFEATQLKDLFEFYPDRASAVASFEG